MIHSGRGVFGWKNMLDEDGLPVDEVGPWAKNKHELLRKYLDISRGVRTKFVSGPGGATYIDLFSGTGRALVRDTGETIDGSPLVAFKCARDGGAPFSEIHIADASADKCRAAEQRLIRAGGLPTAYVGAAEQTARDVALRLNRYGLHFVFLDPFNLQALPLSVIEAFSRLKRVDMLIHVSAQDLQRNLRSYIQPEDSRLERFAPGWRKAVSLNQSRRAIRAGILAHWAAMISELGLPPAQHAELVSGPTKNQRLYWLIFVGRHELASAFWNKIRSLSGQGQLL
jgi:three-Cys-motif partner protein